MRVKITSNLIPSFRALERSTADAKATFDFQCELAKHRSKQDGPRHGRDWVKCEELGWFRAYSEGVLVEERGYSMRTIAIIPCRGGSIGIPRKNLANLAGKPLLAYTIEQAQASKQIDQIVVSTEDSQISEVAMEYGASVIPRPSHLSHGDVMVWEAVRSVAEHFQSAHAMPDLFVELHTTYPFRDPRIITGAIRSCNEEPCDGVLVGSIFYDRIWQTDRERDYMAFSRGSPNIEIKSRQEQEPLWMDHYGLCNVYTPKLALQGNPYNGRIYIHTLTDKISSFDIDDQEDMELANIIMKGKGNKSTYPVFPPDSMGL